MGEIAEALRRAHAERARQAKPREAASPDLAASEDVYSESSRRHDEERADGAAEARAERSTAPAPPAPRPAAPEAAASEPRDTESIRLNHAAVEARVPQGVLADEGGAVTDACLQLALRVRKALRSADARTLMVASAMRDEGKTTVSCNLGLALASLSQVERVALVDLDLRRPSIARALELPAAACGIEDVVSARQPLDAARVRVASPPIDVFPCRRGQLKAHEILLLPSFVDTVAALADRYPIVVFDSPPALLVPDATIIMQHVDCYIPVARAGITRARSFRKMLDLLPKRGLLGAVLDGAASSIRKTYYDQYSPEAEDGDA